MMCAPLCINNRLVAIVPVPPSRRRRPSRKSAALGADDEAMEWKGRSPGSSGAEVEVISFVHVGAVGRDLAVDLNRNMLCDRAAQRETLGYVLEVKQTSIVVGRNANTPSMFLGDCRTCLRIGIKPMKNDRFNHPLGIRQVLRAVIFKRLEKFGVEAIRSLDGLRLVGR
jgi:hypothetical protein